MRSHHLRVGPVGCIAFLAFVCVPASGAAQSVSVTGRLVPNIEVAPGNTNADYSKAVVWLTPTDADTARVGPTPGHFEILQEDKQFLPRVQALPVGSTVDFPNLDPFFHNVFSLFEGKRFDLGLYEAGTSRSAQFDRPGISYIFCNIHPDMVAVIVAVETDLFGLTDTSGRFRIDGVPAGDYQLHVWHERMQPEGDAGDAEVISVGRSDVTTPPVKMETNDRVLEDHTNKFGLEYESPTTSGVPYLGPR